jgi:hypothetical protein
MFWREHKTELSVLGALWGVCTLAVLCIECNPTQRQGVKTVLDLGDAACQQIEKGTDSEYVSMLCTAVDIADGAAHTFLARVKRPDAAVLAARKCPEAKP